MDGDPGTKQDSPPKTESYAEKEKQRAHLLWDEYRRFHESAPIGYFTLTVDNKIIDVNAVGVKMLGATPQGLLGREMSEFVAGPPETCYEPLMKNMLESDAWQECELEMKRGDGSTFFALLQGRRIARANEIVVFATDITRRKSTEDALKESERKYREMTDLLAEGVFECDTGGNVTYANRKVLTSLGLDDDDLKKGIRVFDVIAPQHLAVAVERFGKVLRREDIGAGEYALVRKDGSTFPALVHTSAIVRESKVVGVRGVLVDISERKKIETALQESERKYRELAELLDSGVFEVDANGVITYSNLKGLALFGLSEDDVKSGLNVFDVIAPRDLDAARENFSRVLKQEDIGPAEYLARRKDGTTFPGLTYSSAIIREGVVLGVRGVIVDISELKRAEQALRQSEERLRTTLDSMLEGCLILDFNWRCLYANDSVAQQGQFTREQWVGHTIMELIPETENPETYAHLKEVMEKRAAQRLETELTYPNGAKRWFEVSIEPVPEGILMLYLNITERKQGEERLKQMMAELDRSNRELEQFAYVTSHDLREPLRMMTSFSQSLEKRYKGKLDSTADEYIHFVVDGAARMQGLIDDILVFSRVNTRGLPFEQVEMEQVFQEVLLNLKASIDETGAQVTSGPLPVIQADPTQMKQVLQNLVGNAIKFSREGVSPVVHVSARLEDREWVFSVEDNGIGIDPELFGRLFNLFQRLHPPDRYPGTGVGLAVTKKIVQRHGGRIWVESEPEKGSAFRFSIPLVTEARKDGSG